MYYSIVFFLVTFVRLISSSQSELGHLKPFGSVGSLIEIEEIDGAYPEVLKFFTYYLAKSEPVLSRRVLNDDLHFNIWKTDEQLENEVDGLSKTNILVESMAQPERVSMKFGEFLDKYQKEQLYLADTVPEVLRKYVTVPQPFQCAAALPVLQSAILVINGINTSPLMINDGFDSLFCLFRGNKSLVLVDTNKYPDARQIAMPDLRQSNGPSLDLERVDFNQFPLLANVKYHVANLTAGDCLLVPVNWIFHERSLESTISVVYNIHHKQALNVDLNEVQTCSTSDAYDTSFTLDQIDWTSMESEPQDLKEMILNLVNSNANNYDNWLRTFSKRLSFDLNSDPETAAVFDEFYGIIDIDGNGEITMGEIDSINGPHQHHISDILYEMFKLIDEKQKNKTSPDVKAKVDDRENDEIDERLHIESYKADL